MFYLESVVVENYRDMLILVVLYFIIVMFILMNFVIN